MKMLVRLTHGTVNTLKAAPRAVLNNFILPGLNAEPTFLSPTTRDCDDGGCSHRDV
jgi:hypothetical protein